MSQTSDDRPLLDRLRDLHERMEHDAELEGAYLKDQDAFHRAHGFDPKEVEAALAERHVDIVEVTGSSPVAPTEQAATFFS